MTSKAAGKGILKRVTTTRECDTEKSLFFFSKGEKLL